MWGVQSCTWKPVLAEVSGIFGGLSIVGGIRQMNVRK